MRLTRKPRLLGSNAHRIAGASTVLLALASQLAGARESDATVALSLHHVPPGTAGTHTPVMPMASAVALAAPGAAPPAPAASGPIGWMAAGALMALALYPPGAMRSKEEA